ncbi:hypothetical protein LR48_Vigan09g086300 [Vigna angularis]|uniref:Uncharacterized protein n=1 Tax=Phaseolus angularis TaxID=3914 RepID=A0A0L9VC13_PHAAN|nr:hypothetical protein LR48_Vigan09g086300 [Vigna angularis]
MTGQGSERPDKGKRVARPKKRQRQAPKYVLRVSARLPTIAAPGTSSVGPPSTPTIQPLTHAVHPSPTPIAHPSTSLAADPLPPPVIITPTPPLVVITPTPLPDPTSIPSSSSIPPSETVTPSADPDSSGDGEGEGLDPPLHDRPWIEPYGKGFIPSRVASQAITRSIKQQFLSPRPTWGAIPDDDKKPFWERFQAQALERVVHVDEVFAQTHEEFSTRLSQVRSEHESAPTPDDGSNAEDDIRGTLKHQPSSATTAPDEVVLRLTQALEQRDQEITDLRAEFTNFKALVMRVLPQTSQDEFNIPPTQPRPSLSPAASQQPTSVQPSSVQHSSVQPAPVQPSIEEQDDEDHSDDNYVHY